MNSTGEKIFGVNQSKIFGVQIVKNISSSILQEYPALAAERGREEHEARRPTDPPGEKIFGEQQSKIFHPSIECGRQSQVGRTVRVYSLCLP